MGFAKSFVFSLGLQMRLTGKRIYGLETEWACPLIVRVYAAQDDPIFLKMFLYFLIST